MASCEEFQKIAKIQPEQEPIVEPTTDNGKMIRKIIDFYKFKFQNCNPMVTTMKIFNYPHKKSSSMWY